ncbi:MAG: AzlD domain-containing protein [Planctomycetota bacterium]
MSQETYVWLAILGVTLATFLARSTVLLVGERLRLPPVVESALRYAPACALAGIIAPDLLMTPSGLDLTLGNPRWLAGGAAIIIFAAFRSTLGAIFGGMVVFWLLRAWFGA